MDINKSKLLFPLLLIYMSTALAQINVMENYNGDFEAGTLDHWRFVELADSMAGSFAQITDEAYTGRYSTQITWKSGAGGIIDLVFDNWSSGVEVIPGHTYTLNTAIMAIEGAGLLLHVTLGYFNSAGAVITESTINWVLNNTYEVKELVSTAPGGATNCWIAFRLFESNGSRWPAATAITLIDDVQLWEDPPEITSVVDELIEHSIKVYPNPCSDRLHIVSKTKIQAVSVINMHGQVVQMIYENFGEINMENISTGIYFIKVTTAESSIVKTIVKV